MLKYLYGEGELEIWVEGHIFKDFGTQPCDKFSDSIPLDIYLPDDACYRELKTFNIPVEYWEVKGKKIEDIF